MGIVKDIIGVGVSAFVTGVMFLGAPMVGVVYSLIPGDMIDMLATPERPVVYFDGAYQLSTVEEDGELDGTEDEVVVDPQDDPTEDQKEGVSKDASEDADPDNKTERVGGDVVADAVSPDGTRAGSSRGDGLTRGPSGSKVTRGAKQKKSRRKCIKQYDGIRRRKDGTYEVSRKIVTYYTASVGRFNQLGWSRPNDKGDGKGWFVSGFGCNDALWHGGLRRGDVVLTVNGKKTNNMMQVFMLYSKVKTKKHFEVKVRRRGKQVVLHYDVVKG